MDAEARLELHERIIALKELFNEGKIKIAENHWESLKVSLDKVRYGDDGLVDPGSVDGRVRSLSLVATFDRRRDEAKAAITQREIQELYFQQLKYYFGQFNKMMLKGGGDPEDFAEWLVEQDSLKPSVLTAMIEFMEGLEAFWEAMHYSSWLHEEDAEKSKAIFGGAVFPQYRENVASHLGLYIDTVILSDPFMKLLPIFKMQGIESSLYDLVRLGLQILEYEPLALADIDPPIVVILPERITFDTSYMNYLAKSAETNTLQLAELIFNRPFISREDLGSFLVDFDTVEKLVQRIHNPEYVLFNLEDKRPLEAQILEYMEQLPMEDVQHPGEALHYNLQSRMMQVGDLVNRSMGFRGTPIIQAPTSWAYFNWKLKMDAEAVGPLNREKLHIVRGLGNATSEELAWIGNIPMGSLIELRKQGATEEIKAIISQDISEIIAADSGAFAATSKKVVDNLQAAFRAHEARLKELQNKQLKFFGLDVGGLLVSGKIAFAAAHLDPSLPILASMLGFPTIKDVAKKAIGLEKERALIDRTPIGMLVRAKR